MRVHRWASGNRTFFVKNHDFHCSEISAPKGLQESQCAHGAEKVLLRGMHGTTKASAPQMFFGAERPIIMLSFPDLIVGCGCMSRAQEIKVFS